MVKMAEMYTENVFKFLFIVLNVLLLSSQCKGNDILGCGGFVKSHVSLDYSKIEIGLYSKGGILKEKTECAPTNGYYFLPIYEKGDYILKVHPPPGWSFEPSHVELSIDGETDQCSTGQDVNFSFNGFGITGKVITAGQKQGPSGIAVQLVNDKGEIRNTVTAAGGDFHFTPVIPGQYTVKASHPRWKLDPAQATVQVKEGHTALPVGALAVRGYDVKGAVHANGSPIAGVYVLLYSKEEHPKFRVEGCTTALLQGVPDAPICYSITDQSGEFSFGLVPAGHYKLLALAKSPNQAAVAYNVKPEYVDFSVGHDSQFLKDAFEVTGYTITGSVATSAAGAPMRGVRVSLDGKPVATTDAAGKYTLPALSAGLYTLSFEHENAEFVATPLSISPQGVVKVDKAVASKWRVCGAVRQAAGGAGTARGGGRGVALRRGGATITVHAGDDGKWCTFLSPGVYTAEVEVSEAEKKDGLQFFPVSAQVTVSHGAVSDVVFSQLKATVSGTVLCSPSPLCDGLTVTLRHQPQGSTLTEKVKDGKYTFKDVLPGNVVVSVPSDRYCWDAASHSLAITAAEATVPRFKHNGYVIQIHAQDNIQVDYESASSRGTFTVPGGASIHCVPRAEPLTLTPRGCYLFQPARYTVDITKKDVQPVYITSAGAAATIRVVTSQPAEIYLQVDAEPGTAREGPLPYIVEGREYVYTHTLYMRQGQVAVVHPESPTLVFTPAGPQQVVGGARCRDDALTVLAQPGLVAQGRIQPALEGVTVTLTADDITLTQVTGPDGSYRFVPVRAGRHRVSAHKDGYVMSSPDAQGNIRADKLAEILVKLTDVATGNALEGVLVSVSGGEYRRNVLSDGQGRVQLGGLSPGEYFVKPHVKEFKFEPPHKILRVEEGRTLEVDLTGVRVAWRCSGRVVSLRGGAGGGAGDSSAIAVVATAPACEALEAATDAQGYFTLRGLVPGCVYNVQLKPSSDAQLYKLAHAPVVVQITENKDIEGVRLIAIQPTHLTDTNVLVYTPNIDHYRTLRLKLSLQDSAIYSTKLDAAGYRADMNPGLMYVLPRLPADNNTYVVALESSLSKLTHKYQEHTFYFTSDGGFKHFSIEFLPKAKSSQEELRQTSLLVVPLLGILALIFVYREKIFHQLLDFASQLATHTQTKVTKPNRTEILDKASIDQIVNTVNNTGKRQTKKKTQLIG